MKRLATLVSSAAVLVSVLAFIAPVAQAKPPQSAAPGAVLRVGVSPLTAARLGPRYLQLGDGCQLHSWAPNAYNAPYDWHAGRGGLDSCHNNHSMAVTVTMMQLLSNGWNMMYWTRHSVSGYHSTIILNTEWVNLTAGRWYLTESCGTIDGYGACYNSAGTQG